MLFATLVAVAAAVAPAAAATQATLPLKRVAKSTSLKNVIASDRARIAQYNGASAHGTSTDVVVSGPVTNEDVQYVAPITIGGQTWQLIIATATGNTWCGAQTRCEPTSTGVDTGNTISIAYGGGRSFQGEEYYDTVSFAGLTATNQSIGAATSSSNFGSLDGIIGFGPAVLTRGTVSNTGIVSTFMNTLKRQGAIASEVVGFYFQPESGSGITDTNGELTIGGVDQTKYRGSLAYIPKLRATVYWDFNISNFIYGTTKLLSAPVTTIVDTGTTLIYMPSDGFAAFLNATGGYIDQNTGLAAFNTQPTSKFKVRSHGHTFGLTPAQYLIPAAQYSNFGLNSNLFYAWINDGGPSGINTILGQKFVESYYVALDSDNSRIGFAPARPSG